MTAASLSIKDPTAEVVPRTGLWASLAEAMIHDPRDAPFLELMTTASLALFPLVGYMFLADDFPWWVGVVYLVVNLAGFIDRYNLMLHNTSHRPLFKARFRLLNYYVPMVLGPFFGHTPYTYFGHHMGMHHPENNLPDDLSSTMKYERDNAWHFVRYFCRFFFLGWLELPMYLWRAGRKKMALKSLVGEWTGWAIMAGTFALNPQAALFTFIIPFVFIRVGMMMGNWCQHAFIDAAQPGNSYVNSMTSINTRYNRRCFNDGYHIGHHVKANRHWTEMPEDFQRNLARYAAEKCVVFDGIDFFQVSVLLLTRRYRTLARHFVVLEPGAKPSEDEIIAFLKSRTRPIAAAA